jgi:hypothetical protein
MGGLPFYMMSHSESTKIKKKYRFPLYLSMEKEGILMRYILTSALVFILVSHSVSFADNLETPDVQRLAGKVECNDELKICSYLSLKITARELIAKLNANLFPGSILSPSEGYITTDGIKKINFYINNEDLRNRLIAVIPLMDALEQFDPSDLVLVTTDIYSLTEHGETNLQASLNSASANATTGEIAQWTIKSIFGGLAGTALKIGTNFLSSVLGSSKIKEESSKITSINQLISNQTDINYSRTMKVYISPPGSGVVKEELSGLTVEGVVSISARDSDLVLIKDYHLTYGVVEPGSQGDRVNILSVMNPQLYLVKGISSVVVSSITVDQGRKIDISPLSFGKKTKPYHE